MNRIKYVFSPESEKYDGIRPINIYAMRFIYVLMASFLAFDVWSYIISYDQVWDPEMDLYTISSSNTGIILTVLNIPRTAKREKAPQTLQFMASSGSQT